MVFPKKLFLIATTLSLMAIFFILGFWVAPSLAKNITPIKFLEQGKFLILLQNNSELRSSGGFIGTFAVVEIENFKVKSLNFNTNIYKLDKSFTKTNYVNAPGPLKDFLRGKSWALRDSNYDVSFPQTSDDILDFYQKETGENVDGIIAINASLVEDLLKLTGPIKLEKYNTEISAENFFTQTQYEVEKAYFQKPENILTNEPKTIIKDLYPLIFKRAMSANKFALTKLISRNLSEKQILFYFQNSELENSVLAKNWGGEVFSLSEIQNKLPGKKADYLAVYANNYGANKSSLSIKQKISYQIQDDQRINLALTRIHEGGTAWPDGLNSSYIRVLTTEGSKFVSATINGKKIRKVDITSEAGKTAFGLTLNVAPGATIVLNLAYDLPSEAKPAGLIVQKQPGSIGETLEVLAHNRDIYNGQLDRDKWFSF